MNDVGYYGKDDRGRYPLHHDGSTPTAGSPLICLTLTMNTTTTIKAIAVATGYNNSAVASGTYTIGSTGNPFVNFAPGF